MEAADSCSPLAIESAILELVAAATRDAESMGRGRPPAWLERARTLLADRFGDPVSMAELAAEVGVSRSQLARGCRAWLATTPGGYLRRLRLRYAAERLTDPAEALADVALASGFYDQSHLSNTFRRHYGLTPLEYRRRASNGCPSR